jgi:hypothetical protein
MMGEEGAGRCMVNEAYRAADSAHQDGLMTLAGHLSFGTEARECFAGQSGGSLLSTRTIYQHFEQRFQSTFDAKVKSGMPGWN